MDEIVAAALRKWPNVPHCRGWLGLDTRGQWWLRDAAVQAAGTFPAYKGSRVEHAGLVAFIGRNYGHDADGAWYFQNGPQRVYVELEAAPWVWRLDGEPRALAIRSHTGRPAHLRSLWLDDRDRLYIDTDLGYGLVHTLDTTWAAEAIELGAWPAPQPLPFAQMPARFGFRLSPQADFG